MKLDIVTQTLLNNYGGVLQNYALQQVLQKMGHCAKTIDNMHISKPSLIRYLRSICKTILLSPFPKKRRKLKKYTTIGIRIPFFDSFVNQKVKKTKACLDFKVTSVDVSAVIVGSDQVWRPKFVYCINDMFLDFVKDASVKRIAYAASFGVDNWEYTPRQTKVCSALAKKFDAISVREESGVKLCKEHLGVDATWVLDPTLLLKKEDYLKLCQEIPVNSCRFMAVYVLNLNDSVKATYENIAKEKNLDIKFFTADTKATLSVPEWLAMFRDASYVVTDSFHGTVFSIIFGKEFKCFYNENRGAARFESLLNLYNSGKLEEMREFSINWLKNALES